MIVFTDRGWHIESDQYADELLNEWKKNILLISSSFVFSPLE
ncbi:hypothetical protein ACFSTF_10565 [Terrilactibacillus laevilacticus]|uniref:Uncharacterized protein n=1 Tax=Terrilactibacillus laevilacticus TaxID=1380157 RepID=A0ABW5PSA5_9BACI